MKVRRIVTGVAALATCGVLGMIPAAARASSASVPTWTKQLPAVHPPARWDAAMAYDAANSTVVLFGGSSISGGSVHGLGSTWTWDGTSWTEQHPAVHPPARWLASMAYDAATGTVVLFGGRSPQNRALHDTWTWNGTTWTHLHPAAHPSGQTGAAMTYDAATSSAVLFGGHKSTGGELAETWTWDGTTWTQQAPATSPTARYGAAIAYDTATGTAVLFGGQTKRKTASDTWVWG
jgi:galactose oxidase-like protein